MSERSERTGQLSSGAAFETLIYTDCAPGQGLRGTAGLQFQARSAGADPEAMAVVQRHLLYEPPANWMRQRRPVSDYPPSFAHVWDGHLVTGAGVYLGREATGSREGNQLTHSIVTRDPAAYRLVRPAQLFGAPFWTDRPAPTTECPPVLPDWLPGPFAEEDAQAFVCEHPEGRRWLTALLSAVERLDDPQAPRVLFIAEHPEPVLRWIAAATLLLPMSRALAVGFKVFTTNPAYASQPVVAVHPDWDSTPASVANDLGYAVFDLVRGEHSEVAPTPAAPRWVEWFCTEDVYDVVEMVEIAPQSGLPAASAPVLARAAVRADELTVDDAAVVLSWLRASQPDLLATYRGGLVDRLTQTVERWPPDLLLGLDVIARAGQLPDDRVAPVRLALVKAEVARAAAAGEAAPEAVPPLPPALWRDDHRDAAERALHLALRGARPAAFEALLRVATRFGLPVSIADIGESAAAFVADWAEHPERPYDPGAWPCGAELQDRLVDELLDRIHADPAQSAVVGDRWWSRLEPRLGTLRNRLDEAVLAAAVLHAPPDTRKRLVKEYVAGAQSTDDPGRLVARVAELLFARAVPTYEELRLLRGALPPGAQVDQRLFGRLVEHLLGPDLLAAEPLELLRDLVERGLLRPTAELTALLDADRDLDQLCRRLRTGSGRSGSVTAGRRGAGTLTGKDALDAAAARLRRMPSRLLTLRARLLIDTLLELTDPHAVGAVLAPLPEHVRARYATDLVTLVRDSDSVAGMRTALVLSFGKELDEDLRTQLRDCVVRWTDRASDKRVKQADAQIEALGAQWSRRWADLLEAARKAPWVVRVVRGRRR